MLYLCWYRYISTFCMKYHPYNGFLLIKTKLTVYLQTSNLEYPCILALLQYYYGKIYPLQCYLSEIVKFLFEIIIKLLRKGVM
jgi:hypothetical protein